MRIGIDARLYGTQSGTGIGRYVQELLAQFLEAPHSQLRIPDLQFVVFLQNDGYEAFRPRDDRFTTIRANFPPYSLAAQGQFSRSIRNARVDLMHYTHFDHPLRLSVPFLITIHDLILLTHPSIRASTFGPLRFWMKYAAYRRVMTHAIRQSMRVLTPSQAVKDHIADRLSIMPEKIVSIPLGIDHALHNETTITTQRAMAERRVPPFPYLLYIGNSYPHKNIERLIDAVVRLPNDMRLVLVGREDDFARRLKQRFGHRAQIVFFGSASDVLVQLLLRHAVAYITMSADEGFDLPTVEAFAAGTPVIASDIPVHREILGDLATYIHPERPAHLGKTIAACIADRATLGDARRMRAQQFRWRACATKTWSAYREVIALFMNRHGYTTPNDNEARGSQASRTTPNEEAAR